MQLSLWSGLRGWELGSSSHSSQITTRWVDFATIERLSFLFGLVFALPLLLAEDSINLSLADLFTSKNCL